MTRPDSRAWPLRDYPVLLWLALAGMVALVHRYLPEARWLMVHLVVLGALTHAIVVWSTHFTQALLKTPAHLDERRTQSRRLGLLILGAAAVIVGVPTGWWGLVIAGAVGLATAVGWHAWALARRLRAALPGRFRVTVRYYLAAAAALPIGATFGAWLAHGVDAQTRGRLLMAHTMTMALGWVGLTVAGTLLTLWPTMLRTRIDARAERWARQALPALVLALTVLVVGALAGWRGVALAGLVGYLGGWVWTARALLAPARQAPPKSFATWSATAGLAWFAVTLVLVGVDLATAADWARVPQSYGLITPALVAGFAVQLLSGALAHLVPVVLGGGARAVRAAQQEFDRYGAARVLLANAALVVCLLPVPSWVRVTCSVLVLVALGWFLPATYRAIRAALRTKAAIAREATAPGAALPADGTSGSGPVRPTLALPRQPSVFSSGQLVAALSALALAVAVGVIVDPAAAGLAGSAGGATGGLRAPGSLAADGPVVDSGRTTTVRVEAKGMRFVPDTIEVPRGDRLRVEFVNADPSQPHDLVFATGARSARLDPGASQTVDVGVIGADVEGWCSIIGHRQMGMVIQVRVKGGLPDLAAGGHGGHGMGTAGAGGTAAGAAAGQGSAVAAPGVRLGGTFPDDFRAVPAELPALSSERTHRMTLRVEEVELEIAPGVRQKRWTYNGAVPGPTLHGRIGDVFEITLVNNGSIGHSIDFHAGDVAPDGPMRTIPPGESLVYRFTAKRAGIWMYHCSTMPMSAHIAAGMHGAVVIEPDGLPAVERSYVLVQSEAYVDGDGTSAAEVNMAAVTAEQPSAVVFNGIANQYDARPLTARVGERVRFWALAAGPNRPSSFHVVGGQFDTLYFEGAYQVRRGVSPGGPSAGGAGGGAQVLGLHPAQGGFVEMVAVEAGTYPFVSHLMVDAERGAHGLLTVTG